MRLQKWSRPVVLMLLASLGGCSSGPFGQFYDGMTAEQVKADPTLLPCSMVDMDRLDGEQLNQQDFVDQQYELGYILIGSSSFEANSGQASGGQASAQGRRIGACKGFWGNRAFVGQLSYNVTTYNQQPIGAYQNSAGQTQYVFDNTPYQQTVYENRYNFMALYFAEINRNAVFGVRFDKLTDEEMRIVGRDYGVYVKAVIQASLSDQVGVRKGDVFLQLGDNKCTFENFAKACGSGNWRSSNDAVVYRAGKMEKLFLAWPAPPAPAAK